MNTREAIALLEAALENRRTLADAVRQLQKAAWSGELGDGPDASVLEDLAYDLDFWESDPRARGEDPVFIDEKSAVSKIESAIQRIRAISDREAG